MKIHSYKYTCIERNVQIRSGKENTNMSTKFYSNEKADILIHNLHNETVSLLLLITNILYGIVLLLESYMPLSLLFAIVTLYNSFVMAVEANSFCNNTVLESQRSDENRLTTVGEICRYFPVSLYSLRKAQYHQITKVILLQMLVTIIGMVLVFPLADIRRILAALGMLLFSMLLIGVYEVERGLGMKLEKLKSRLMGNLNG